MLRLLALAAAMALAWATLELRSLTAAPASPAFGSPDAPASPRARLVPIVSSPHETATAPRPESGRPGLGRPDFGRPDLGRPEIGRPEIGRPEIGRPDLGRPDFGQLDLDGGVPRTARAVRAALERHSITGHTWLGKLASVGGGRDTIIHVPSTVDVARTIDVILYMEGHGSFADAAMDHRHAAAIARLRGNAVYVAPDAPSSAHGDRTAKTAYWQRGCAERRCAGGHAAPGDFLAFLDDVRAHLAAVTGADPAALDLQLSLVGFSNGGKGLYNAITQLADADFVAGGHAVRIADVIFADANYGGAWLAETWRHLAARPEAPRLTILVADGSFTSADRTGGNRRRAAAFWRSAAPTAPAPAPGRSTESLAAAGHPRLRIIPLRASHHAIGDAAVDYLTPPALD